MHFRVESSDWPPELVSLQLKFSSQNSANQMFRRLFSRERVMKYWSNPKRWEGGDPLSQMCLSRVPLPLAHFLSRRGTVTKFCVLKVEMQGGGRGFPEQAG